MGLCCDRRNLAGVVVPNFSGGMVWEVNVRNYLVTVAKSTAWRAYSDECTYRLAILQRSRESLDIAAVRTGRRFNPWPLCMCR